MSSPSVATILRDQVSLSTSCIDRLYLNGYVPRLQTSGQLCAFLCDHLGNRIASPAAIRPIHDRFVDAVRAFADVHLVPIVQFERRQRKDDIAARYRSRFAAAEPAQANASLERLAEINVRWVLPGHGPAWGDTTDEARRRDSDAAAGVP